MDNNYNIGYSVNMQNLKWYNPNKFNPLDSTLAYLIMLVSFFLLPYGFQYFVQLLVSFGVRDIYVLLSISAIVSQAVILGIALIYSKILNVNAFNGGGFKSGAKPITVLMSAVLIMGMLVMFSPVTETFVDGIYRLGGTTYNYDYNGNELVALFYALVLSSVLPAICEELLFRGIILRGLLPYGKTFAIVMSSLMFALAHGSFSQLLYQFLVGLAIGTVVVMTKNIMLGMIMHFTNNFFASIYSIIIGVSENISAQVKYISTVLCIVLGSICLITGIIYFMKYAFSRYKKQLLKEKTETNIKSCLSFDKTFESATFINYDEPIRYSTADEPINFYHKTKGFITMRRKVKNLIPLLLLAFDLLFAVMLILNDYFSLI